MNTEGIHGKLFRYSSRKNLVAFQCGEFERQIVFIGGLTDGFLAVPYLTRLCEVANQTDWGVTQVLLSSSYTGYGISSLESDAAEIDELLVFLKANGVVSVVLLGHSTGCQDAVFYMRSPSRSSLVKGVILQAPVSDREYMATLSNTEVAIKLAKGMKHNGNEEELMPRDVSSVPITANRFLSLSTQDGDDDMFSSDLTQDFLAQKLGHMNIPTLIVMSLRDEYIPSEINIPLLVQKLKSSIPGSIDPVLLEGNHSLEGLCNEFSDIILGFIQSV